MPKCTIFSHFLSFSVLKTRSLYRLIHHIATAPKMSIFPALTV